MNPNHKSLAGKISIIIGLALLIIDPSDVLDAALFYLMLQPFMTLTLVDGLTLGWIISKIVGIMLIAVGLYLWKDGKQIQQHKNKIILSIASVVVVVSSMFFFNILSVPSFMVVPEITNFEVEGCNIRQIPCHTDYTTNQRICPESFTYKTEQIFDMKCPTKPDNYQLDCMPGNVNLKPFETACWVSFTAFNCLKPDGILGIMVSGAGDLSNMKLRLNGKELGKLQYNTLSRTWDIPFDFRDFDLRCSLQPKDVNCYTTDIPNNANKLEIINEGITEVEIYSVKARVGLETLFICNGEMCQPLNYEMGCEI